MFPIAHNNQMECGTHNSNVILFRVESKDNDFYLIPLCLEPSNPLKLDRAGASSFIFTKHTCKTKTK